MTTPAFSRPRLVVGNGMAGARLDEDVLALNPGRLAAVMFGGVPYGNSDGGACDQPSDCPVGTYPVEVVYGLVRVGVPVDA